MMERLVPNSMTGSPDPNYLADLIAVHFNSTMFGAVFVVLTFNGRL